MAINTLFDAAVGVYEDLALLKQWEASGGTATSIVFDVGVRIGADDRWNNGAAFVLYVDGAGTAPENEFAIISDYTQSSRTASLANTLGGAVADGHIIGVVPGKIDLQSVIAGINGILKKVGVINKDETITTVAGQTEYNLPTTVPRGALRKVYYQYATDNSLDNEWQEVSDWRLEPSAVSVADVLILPGALDDGRTIQLFYEARHPRVKAASDVINEIVNLAGLTARVAVKMMQEQMMYNTGMKFARGLMNYLITKEKEESLTYMVLPNPTKWNTIRRRDNFLDNKLTSGE